MKTLGPKELEYLVEHYQKRLLGICYGMTRNGEEARDLAQDIWLKVLKSIHLFELGTNFWAWIYQIAINMYINRYRKNQRRDQYCKFVSLEELEEDASTGTISHGSFPSPEKSVLNRICDEDLTSALLEMPDKFRDALLLSLIHKLRYKEIADYLKIPIGTVRSRIFRGRRCLRQRLNLRLLQAA